MVTELETSRDGLIRKVDIKYRNSSEAEDRTTRRSVRTICKIWSEDDYNLQDDLHELAVKLQMVGVDLVLPTQQPASGLAAHHQQSQHSQLVHSSVSDDGCCCSSHCSLIHDVGTPLRLYQALATINNAACDLYPQVPFFTELLDEKLLDEDCSEEMPLDNLSEFLLNFQPATGLSR